MVRKETKAMAAGMQSNDKLAAFKTAIVNHV